MKKYYIEHLRVIAIIAVIIIHVTAGFYHQFGQIEAVTWWFSNVLNAASRFAVPVFIMISGAVLLGRKISILDFYRKRSVRLIPPLIFWNLVFVGYSVYNGMGTESLIWFLKIGFFIEGRAATHLWYLSMLLCLMMLAPFVNQYLTGTKPSANDLLIFLLVVFFFFLLNGIAAVAKQVASLNVNWFRTAPWFLGYFVAGYYIDQYGAKLRVKNIYLVLIIISLTLVGMALNYVSATSLGVVKDYFILDNDRPLVFLIAICIFLLVSRLHVFSHPRKLVERLSDASFGIYLVHPIFIGEFKKWLPSYEVLGLCYIPLVIFLTFVTSFMFIIIIRQNRILRKIC